MTKDLAVEINRWRTEFEALHPRNEGRSGYVGNTGYSSRGAATRDEYGNSTQTLQMGPIDWLSEKTGLGIRAIFRITNNETKWTSLSVADKILTAIGSYHKIGTGEIRVVPNPTWTTEKYVEYLRSRGCA